MENRVIGIDPSLSSTAVCTMNGVTDVFHCFTTSDTKWTRAMEPCANIRLISYCSKSGKDRFSDSEVEKLNDYRRNAYEIVDTCVRAGDRVYMESYAPRAKGNIVDLVVFGTFIRERIIDKGATLVVIPPMALKKKFAEAVYQKDKKGIARNNQGVAGGSFKKHQMMLGVYEMVESSEFKTAMEAYRSEIMDLKNIPSPLNDCVDAFAAAYLGFNNKI